MQPDSHEDIESNLDNLKTNIKPLKHSQHEKNVDKLNFNHKEKVTNWLENN